MSKRPTVQLTHPTSVAYAEAANSRVLGPHHQRTLDALAAGLETDAYEANAALMAAMSSAATRVGASTGRRELTRKIRHLAYKVQAIIENHADELPAYEQGERSRKIEDLEKKLQDRDALLGQQTLAVENLRAQVLRQRHDLAEAQMALHLEQQSRQRIDDEAFETVKATSADNERLEVENHNLNALVRYALDLLDEAGQAQVEGFVDGLLAAQDGEA